VAAAGEHGKSACLQRQGLRREGQRMRPMRNGGEAYVWCLNVSGWQARRGRHVVESAPFRGTSEACSLRVHTLPYTQHVLHIASALVLESTALTSEIPPMRRRNCEPLRISAPAPAPALARSRAPFAAPTVCAPPPAARARTRTQSVV